MVVAVLVVDSVVRVVALVVDSVAVLASVVVVDWRQEESSA